MKTDAYALYRAQVDEMKTSGTSKEEWVITTPQGAHIDTTTEHGLLNMCANNYLGLADDPTLIATVKNSYDKWGFGTAAARFICGTQQLHKELEQKIADFLGMEDAIVYPSCFDANGGLFEPLLGPEDAIISDSLNHASIIDGIRLCKAQRYRYNSNDMDDLQRQLEAASGARFRMIATDGVFSMDGYVADLKKICELAEKYDAMVMVDDSHGIGVIGEHGKGSPEACGVLDKVDIITGTLGKALGGAAGGFTAAKKEVIELLRNKSRSYLFTNSLSPAVCAAGIAVLDRISESKELQQKLRENTSYFRAALEGQGFDVLPGIHPIVPVMLYDAHTAKEFSERMIRKGVYVTSLAYPVVPKGKARIRAQVSAVHTREDLDFAVDCFVAVRKELGLAGSKSNL